MPRRCSFFVAPHLPLFLLHLRCVHRAQVAGLRRPPVDGRPLVLERRAPRAVGVPSAVTRSRGIGPAAATRSVEEEADAGSSFCCKGEACRGRSRQSRRARLGRGHCRPSITSTIHLGASTVGCLDSGATYGRTQREATKICSLCSSRLEIVPNSIHR
jgi:hypothetical protein